MKKNSKSKVKSFKNYTEVEEYKKSSHKSDEDFHRFTGLLKKPTPPKHKAQKTEPIPKKINQKLVQECIDDICENMVEDLGLGHLSDSSSGLGLRFILPVSPEINAKTEELGRTYRHAVSSGVSRFFKVNEHKCLLDDRISSLLPPTADKQFGCEQVKLVFDPILDPDDPPDCKGSIYVEIYACPYLITIKGKRLVTKLLDR